MPKEAMKLILLLILLTPPTVKGSRNIISPSLNGRIQIIREREKSMDMDTLSGTGNGIGVLGKFGDSCNESHKCNFNDWLTCERTSTTKITSSALNLNLTKSENVSTSTLPTNGSKNKNKGGTCVCRDSDDLFFETLSNRCVARVGATCRRLVHLNDEPPPKETLLKGLVDNSPMGIQNYSYPSHLLQIQFQSQNQNQMNSNDNRIAKRIDCVHNAICDPTPIFVPRCRCHKGYYSTTNGTCEMQKTAPESCSSSDECILLLSCIENVCQCKGSLIFDRRENRCAIPNGSPCEPLDSSNPNQNQNQRTAIKFQYCTSNAACSHLTKTCQCKNGLVSHSADGTLCRPVYGEPCSKWDPCANSYSCHNGICTCKFHFHQQYDPLTKECRSLVQGPCQENSNSYNCTQNAHCLSAAEGAFKECQCLDGYLDTADGKCLKGYATECKHDNECYEQLFCIDFKCQCKDQFQKFNSTNRQCEGVVGSRCSVVKNYSGSNSGMKDVESNSIAIKGCTANAICVSNGFTHSYGRCECNMDLYVPNSERICVSRSG